MNKKKKQLKGHFTLQETSFLERGQRQAAVPGL